MIRSRRPLNRIIRSFSLVLLALCFAAPALRAQANADCLACHEDKGLTMERGGRTVSLFVSKDVLARSPHAKHQCVSCHRGFNPEDVPHKDPMTKVSCTACHKAVELKHPFHAARMRRDRAAGTLDASCKSCHGSHDVVRPSAAGSRFAGAKLPGFCGTCHGEVVARFQSSAHGQAMAAGTPDAPTCVSCHTQDVSNASGKLDSLSLKRLQQKVCLDCHVNQEKATGGRSSKFFAMYEASVHGRALLGGNARAANCVDCHGSHEMNKRFRPESKTNKMNLADDCGKCHGDIATTYKESVHGVAVARGDFDAPTCADCHGEHNILAASDPKSPVNTKNLARRVCEPCHSSQRLGDAYGFSTSKARSFEDSYHGLALRGGDASVANCASCHGVHNIRPSSDPLSTINKNNLAKTCGSCHPGAGVRFAQGSVHGEYRRAEDPAIWWLETIYTILIFAIIGGMLVHNIADFRRKAKHKLAVRRGEIPPHRHSNRSYVRMTREERIQHVLLLTSFFLLVITGFMLRFPDAWWVRLIREVSSGAFEVRSLLHRIAGVVMAGASLYHVYYIAFTARGRQLVIDLFPRLSDVGEAIGMLKYNFGLSNEKPRLGRFSYIEKAEYWALIWGNVVMIATGVVMWFDNYFMNIFGKLGWDIARTIHYYEAWLAFLAIVVWHLYFVIFNPDAYPMNMAWLRGTLSEEEMADEHPRELDRLRGSDEEIIPFDPPGNEGSH